MYVGTALGTGVLRPGMRAQTIRNWKDGNRLSTGALVLAGDWELKMGMGRPGLGGDEDRLGMWAGHQDQGQR